MESRGWLPTHLIAPVNESKIWCMNGFNEIVFHQCQLNYKIPESAMSWVGNQKLFI